MRHKQFVETPGLAQMAPLSGADDKVALPIGSVSAA
jgi:hypothetical protein